MKLFYEKQIKLFTEVDRDYRTKLGHPHLNMKRV